MGLPILLWYAADSASCCSSSTPSPPCGPAAAAGPARQARADRGGAGPPRHAADPRQRRQRLHPHRRYRTVTGSVPASAPARADPRRPRRAAELCGRAARVPGARSSSPATRCRSGRCPASSRRSPRPPPRPTATRTWALSRCATPSPSGTASTPSGSPPAAVRWRWPSTWSARPACAGDEILYSWRSFEAYPIIAATSGATSVRGAEHRRRTATTSRRWRRRSPTAPGWCWSATRTTRPVRRSRKAELDAFLDAVPQNVLVVMDEAYREFVTDRRCPTR